MRIKFIKIKEYIFSLMICEIYNKKLNNNDAREVVNYITKNQKKIY